MNRPSTTRTALRSALASCLLALGACEATQLPRSDMPLDVREPFVATDPVDRPPQPLPEPVVPVVVRPPRPTIGDAAEYAFELVRRQAVGLEQGLFGDIEVGNGVGGSVHAWVL